MVFVDLGSVGIIAVRILVVFAPFSLCDFFVGGAPILMELLFGSFFRFFLVLCCFSAKRGMVSKVVSFFRSCLGFGFRLVIRESRDYMGMAHKRGLEDPRGSSLTVELFRQLLVPFPGRRSREERACGIGVIGACSTSSSVE